MTDPAGGDVFERRLPDRPRSPFELGEQPTSVDGRGLGQETPLANTFGKVLTVRSWSRTIDYGIFAVFAVQCVLTAVAAFVSLPLSVQNPGPSQFWAVTLTVVPLVAVSGLLLATQWPRPFTTAIAGVGVFAGQIWSAWSLNAFPAKAFEPEPEIAWWGWQPTVTLCILVGATYSGRQLIPPTLIVGLSYLAVRLSVPTDWRHLTTEILVLGQVAAVASLIVPVWRQIGTVADAAARRESEARMRLAPIRAREQREQAANRLLHDEIIHTLRALATPATSSRSNLVDMVVKAMAQLDSERGVAGAECDLRAELRAATNSIKELCVEMVPGPPLSVAPELSNAIVGAAAEALRNVARHSGSQTARVEVTGNPGDFTVTVIDAGRGFDPAAVSPGAFGLRWSIRQQVANVGGAVQVDSRDGQGTTVTISWPEPSRQRRDSVASIDDLVDLAGLRVALIVAIALPQSIGGLLQSLVQGPTTSVPILSIGAAALAGGLTLYSIRFRLDGPVPGWYSAVLCLVALLVAWLAGVALDPESRSGLGYYPLDLVAPVLLIVALMRPRWEALFTALAVGAVAAAMASSTVIGVDGYLAAVFLCPVSALLILLVRIFVDRLALGTQRSLDLSRESWDEQIRASQSRQGRAEQLQRIVPIVMPFLGDITTGKVDVIDPAAASTAQLMELAIRDQLAVGKSLQTSTQQAILRGRIAGHEIQINAATDGGAWDFAGSPNQPAEMVDLVLSRFLAVDGRWKSLVISTGAGVHGPQFVSALVRPPNIPPTVSEAVFSENDTWMYTENFALLRIDLSQPLAMEVSHE